MPWPQYPPRFSSCWVVALLSSAAVLICSHTPGENVDVFFAMALYHFEMLTVHWLCTNVAAHS